jgi:hypothetical protein
VSDTSDDPDLDGLMERICGELAQRRLGDGGGMPDAPAAVSAPLLPPASSWADQTVVDPTRRRYSARELLRLPDAAFLRAAYLAVLGREPDQAGWSVTLPRLRRPESSRVEVLHSRSARPLPPRCASRTSCWSMSRATSPAWRSSA